MLQHDQPCPRYSREAKAKNVIAESPSHDSLNNDQTGRSKEPEIQHSSLWLSQLKIEAILSSLDIQIDPNTPHTDLTTLMEMLATHQSLLSATHPLPTTPLHCSSHPTHWRQAPLPRRRGFARIQLLPSRPPCSHPPPSSLTAGLPTLIATLPAANSYASKSS